MTDKNILHISSEENGLNLSVYEFEKKIEVSIGVSDGDNITMSIRQFIILHSLVNQLLETYMKIKDFAK